MTIGIIGWGIAGLRVAAELRSNGYDGTIIAWNDDEDRPYDRPPLSKDLFGDYLHELADDGLGEADELRVTIVRERASAVRQAEEGWIVQSQSESTLVDSLVLATGCCPTATIPGARTLYSRVDAEKLRARIHPGSRVHIVGAGWIGTELASVCAERGAHVEIWEASPHILDRTFHGEVDDIWRSWLAAAGVILHLGTPYPSEPPSCDICVQATGARPSLGFVSDGLRSPRGGIAVTLRGEVIVSVGSEAKGGAGSGTPALLPRLYAAGDVADVLLPDGSWRYGGHWTQALSDAARVASTILNLPLPSRLDAPEVFSTQFGHEIGLVGTVPAGVHPEVTATAHGLVYRWAHPELVALLGIDSPREVSQARKALRTRLS